MSNKYIIISFGNRSVFNRIMASIFFAAGLYVGILFFIRKPIIFTDYYINSLIHIISFEIMILGFALPHAISIAHHFNLKQNEYRKFYYVGPIGYGVWKRIKKLDRVSTFFNNREECEVNIWDIYNKRYKIAVFNKIEDAVIYGRDLAKTLQIKFKERN